MLVQSVASSQLKSLPFMQHTCDPGSHNPPPHSIPGSLLGGAAESMPASFAGGDDEVPESTEAPASFEVTGDDGPASFVPDGEPASAEGEPCEPPKPVEVEASAVPVAAEGASSRGEFAAPPQAASAPDTEAASPIRTRLEERTRKNTFTAAITSATFHPTKARFSVSWASLPARFCLE